MVSEVGGAERDGDLEEGRKRGELTPLSTKLSPDCSFQISDEAHEIKKKRRRRRRKEEIPSSKRS